MRLLTFVLTSALLVVMSPVAFANPGAEPCPTTQGGQTQVRQHTDDGGDDGVFDLIDSAIQIIQDNSDHKTQERPKSTEESNVID